MRRTYQSYDDHDDGFQGSSKITDDSDRDGGCTHYDWAYSEDVKQSVQVAGPFGSLLTEE